MSTAVPTALDAAFDDHLDVQRVRLTYGVHCEAVLALQRAAVALQRLDESRYADSYAAIARGLDCAGARHLRAIAMRKTSAPVPPVGPASHEPGGTGSGATEPA
jgi:hypothetical protein